MEIDPKLQVHLSKFKRLEDFRVDVSLQSSAFLASFVVFKHEINKHYFIMHIACIFIKERIAKEES